jgi:hypothetical protein
MSGLLTDLLYFDIDKDALIILFTSFALSHNISDSWIKLLVKKIERFGDE